MNLIRILLVVLTSVIMVTAVEAKMTVVDVTKFGAVPNDGKSDTAAVLAALEECKKHSPVTLLFPRGKYHFFAGNNPKSRDWLFGLLEYDGLTIDGQGSELIVSGLTGVFCSVRCKGLTFKNLSIDWDRPPFSLGKVIAAEGEHFDVEVYKEYPVSGGEPVGAFMDYDPKTHLPMRHGLDEYYTAKSTELIAPQTLRVHLKHQARIKPGVDVLLRHQVYGKNAFYAGECTDVVVKNVNVYTAPGMGFGAGKCTNIKLDHFNVTPRSGSTYPMSATADAVHLSGNKGLISIKNCEFDGMGDDAANIKTGLYLMVKSKVDDRTVIAAHNLKIADPPDPGDVVEIMKNEDCVPFATARVKKVETLPNDGLHKIEFTEPLPDALKEGCLIGNATRTARVRVSNCKIRNNRARGFLIQNRDVVVENCHFQNCTSGGVWVITEVWYFYESIGSRDVIVRNNTFENCNYGGPLGEGVLSVYVTTGPNKYGLIPGVHKNVLLEGNKVIGADNSAIFVSGTDGLTIRNNTIENACLSPTHPTGSNAIHIMGSRNVRIENNNVEPQKQGPNLKNVIKFGPGCEMSTISEGNNKGF